MTEHKQRIRFGVIGLGAMGAELIRAADDHPDVVVTIACDRNEKTLARHKGQYPRIAFTTDPGVVLKSDIDAIYIATPPAFHAELTLAALSSGLPVFCEKPLAVDMDDGRVMVEASQAAGVPAAVNFALSDRHAVLELERALKAGDAGEIVGVDIQLRFPHWPRDFQSGATWLDGREQGGFVREVFSHFAYLTDRLVGPMEPIHVNVDYAAERAERAARGFLRAGGVPVHFSAFAGAAAPERYEWYLWGSRQSFFLDAWGDLFSSDGGLWTPVALTAERGSEATRLSRFAKAVRGGPMEGLADFAAALRVQQVVEAFHRP